MPAEGGDPEVLSGKDAFFPVWSADGSDVYFTWHKDLGDIWVMDVIESSSR